MVPPIQVESYYDMSELQKTFVLGVRNDSGVLHSASSLDTQFMAPFQCLHKLTCKLYLVFKSVHALIGAHIINKAGDKHSKLYYKARSVLESKSSLLLKAGEHIERVTVGSLDNSINAIEISTTLQTMSLGSLSESDYKETFDKSRENRVIIGFQFNFSDSKMVELYVFNTKLLRKNPGLRSKVLLASNTLKKNPRVVQISQLKQTIMPSCKSF